MEDQPLWITGRYNDHHLRLSRNIGGSVNWHIRKQDKDWIARFMDTDLGGFDDFEAAKKAVEDRAKRELEYALAKLNRREGGTK